MFETGALLSIRLHELDAFTRYFLQLQPFYELQGSALNNGDDGDPGQRSKITGLYLLLLLTKGDYAGFHTVLEGLEVEGTANEEGIDMALEGEEEAGDKYIQYPIKLERWLMEGSYDRVWGATKREGVPSEEFGEFSEVSQSSFPFQFHMCILKEKLQLSKISLQRENLEMSLHFSPAPPLQKKPPLFQFTIPLTISPFPSLIKVLIGTIRSEIASCSEKAYPSLPIASAKTL